VHLAKTFDHVPAGGADQVPLHFKQSQLGTVEKQVNGFGFCNPLFGRELDWINPKESLIVFSVDEGLWFGNDARRPRANTFKFAQEITK